MRLSAPFIGLDVYSSTSLYSIRARSDQPEIPGIDLGPGVQFPRAAELTLEDKAAMGFLRERFSSSGVEAKLDAFSLSARTA
jgi:hypothetical protein